ncbi:OmpP1/FadL family transporter [Geomonas subterranea]|uniref:OmpP1/FadL family transporter n=1 Tax=Geomonas subterranea TaxID=2847989 RepID=UPI001CD44A13|nr:outer membrane protein transport protein [Geomonas fuzhouensis]
MAKRAVLAAAAALVLSFSLPKAWATNGDTLIGVAPASRAMGGAGVAAPQDAISAIFANPAAVCMGPYCPGSEFVFASTIYDPSVKATVRVGPNTTTAKSDMKPFIIPAVGMITPISDRLRFGLGMFGITGMGVDYRNKGIDLNPLNAGSEGDIYTQLQILKFAPNIAFLVTPDFSIGTSMHLLYGSLDLGQGTAHNYGFGEQFGALYRAGSCSFGASYTTPEKISHQNVTDFGSGLQKRQLSMESPRTASAGIAWRPTEQLLIETDAKWLNWKDAEGYKEFDWKNQWVYALGMQYKDPDGLTLRLGYNYGKSPVRLHKGFDAAGTTSLQGSTVPTLLYEYLRMIGFPAIAEHHFTCGIGYQFSSRFEAHLGGMWALDNTTSETDASGTFSFGSNVRETSYDLGLIWNFM